MEQYGKVNAREAAQVPICEKTVTTELSGDFTLPDYQPEIKRLLRIGACVLPPSKYIGEGHAEFAGNVDYYVFYTASDNEIYCAPLVTEYRVDVPMDRSGEWSAGGVVGNAEIETDMISGRVTSPRKLNIKCRLKTHARIMGDVTTCRGQSEADNENEVLRGVVSASRSLFGSSDMTKLSDEMIIDSRDGEIRVISADGRALINEVACSEGAVNCRGDVYLKIMMMREGTDAPFCTTRKLPMSVSVAMEGITPRCQAAAKATVCEMSLDVEENRILIDLGVLTDVCAVKPERVSYVKDAYSTVYKTDCQYSAVMLPMEYNAFNANFTLSDSASLEELSISPDSTVTDSWGSAAVDKISVESGRMSVTGRARFTLLLRRDGEYTTQDVELPFKYVTDTALEDGETITGSVSPSVISVRARLDGERVGIDSEIGLCALVSGMKSISVLDSVSFGDEIERSRGEYVICYPAKDDSVWSVAKRYGAPVTEVSKNNRISEEHAYDSRESLDGIGYLVI